MLGAKDGCASRTSVGGSPTPAADGGFLKGQNVGEPGLEFRYCDSWLYWYMSPTHLRCLWLLLGVCLGCLETVGLDLRSSPLPLGQGPTVAFTNKPVQGGAYQLKKGWLFLCVCCSSTVLPLPIPTFLCSSRKFISHQTVKCH